MSALHPPTEALAIVNPAAGGGRARRAWERLRPRLQDALPFRESLSEAPGHAVVLAREAVAAGTELIIAVGGDGTVHEIANGLLAAQREGGRRAALGIIPVGTANDFAGALGVPAQESAVDLIAARTLRRVDAGEVGGHFFVNAAGVGFDAEVAREVNRMNRRVRGAFTYILGVFKMLARYTPVDMDVKLDGAPRRLKSLLIAVANTPRYGGGFRICPDAQVDDGILDVCLAGDVGKIETVLLLPRVFTGSHVHHPKVEMARAREITIAAARPLVVHADGEIVGETPVTFRVLPQALGVIAPGGPPRM